MRTESKPETRLSAKNSEGYNIEILTPSKEYLELYVCEKNWRTRDQDSNNAHAHMPVSSSNSTFIRSKLRYSYILRNFLGVSMMKLNAGKTVAYMLNKYGVRYVFGMPGGQTLQIYDGIYELRPEIQHVLVRDERNGAFMADGYARISYRPGVCDGTVGPGALNLVTGIAEAYRSSIPILAITSDIATPYVGKNPSQECDQMSIFKSITKWSVRVERADKIPELVRRAFNISTSHRPGPVHLDFPEDIIMEGTVSPQETFIEEECREYPSTRVRPDPSKIKEAAELLLEAERPAMLVGGGGITSQAWEEVTALAELLIIPVATTIMGKGIVSEAHPLSLGVLGLFGQKCANAIIKNSDLVLVVGSKLSDLDTARYTVPEVGQPIIHIDVDPAEIGRTYPVKERVVGDAKLSLQDLISVIKERVKKKKSEETPRIEEIRKLKKEWFNSVSPMMKSDKTPATPYRILKEIRKFLAKEDILVCDASTASLWAAILYDLPLAGRRFIAPRGIAPIGYGFPAAIGAKLAAPDRKVLAFCGDGGFGLSLTELDTAVRNNIPVITVVHNNHALGWIKFVQNKFYRDRNISVDHRENLNFAEVARSYGCFGIKIEKPAEIHEALEEAYKSAKPSVIDIPEDATELLPQLNLG